MNLGNCDEVFDTLKTVEEGGIGEFFTSLNLTPDECQEFCKAITEMSNEIGYGTVEKLTGGGPGKWRTAFIIYLTFLATAVDAGKTGMCAVASDRQKCKNEKKAQKATQNYEARRNLKELDDTRVRQETAKGDAEIAATNAAEAKSRSDVAEYNVQTAVSEESIASAATLAVYELARSGAVNALEVQESLSSANKLRLEDALRSAKTQLALNRIHMQTNGESVLYYIVMIGTFLILARSGIRALNLPQAVYNAFGIGYGGPQPGPPRLGLAAPLAAATVIGAPGPYPTIAQANVPPVQNLPGYNNRTAVNPDPIIYPLPDGNYSNPIMDINEAYNASRIGYRVYEDTIPPGAANPLQIQTVQQLHTAHSAPNKEILIRWASTVLGGHRYKKSRKHRKQTRNQRKQRKQTRNQRR